MIIDPPLTETPMKRNMEDRQWKPFFAIFPKKLIDGRIAFFHMVERRYWVDHFDYRA